MAPSMSSSSSPPPHSPPPPPPPLPSPPPPLPPHYSSYTTTLQEFWSSAPNFSVWRCFSSFSDLVHIVILRFKINNVAKCAPTFRSLFVFYLYFILHSPTSCKSRPVNYLPYISVRGSLGPTYTYGYTSRVAIIVENNQSSYSSRREVSTLVGIGASTFL